ncbi:hypothetical protein V1260_08540 [Brachybacterium sp. J144]|uniref:hypothetical protein n=1 Tax=Brachybacterium sp. J144 TaxID=3116487 RepID=UPI002E78F020|nr:hypothetical protein [Brachybacterium sp. J144]MEE1650838.1 hypothetical protein [Brachybacterium sp. J144]
MEVNPYEARLRLLQQMDGVQMQREAAPDEETAGCPGCPYFWTCPVPHRGEEVRAPAEIELEDVAEALGPRRAFRPRDESDVGWSDTWVDEEGLTVDAPEPAEELEAALDSEPPDGPASEPARRGPRTWFRRRR